MLEPGHEALDPVHVVEMVPTLPHFSAPTECPTAHQALAHPRLHKQGLEAMEKQRSPSPVEKHKKVPGADAIGEEGVPSAPG